MQIQNFGEYHDLYLKMDVLLLASVFENFRKMGMENFNLDPAHEYTLPGFSWTSMMKMTECCIELISDIDMYLFMEQGIRGGLAMVSNRYSATNCPELPETFNPNLPHKYLCLLDFNNLYGHALSQSLPLSDYRWLSQRERDNFSLFNIPPDSSKGYVLEVDLTYPPYLHNLTSDYPLAPVKSQIEIHDLSQYSQKLLDEFGDFKYKPGVKLNATLHNRLNYIVHYQTLKLYLELGMELIKIHRVLQFHQEPFIRPYIQFNTKKRQEAKNSVQSSFFKLQNNSIYGKTLQSNRNQVSVFLVTDEQKMLSLINKPTFNSYRIINPNLVGINVNRSLVELNNPVQIGFAVLELSKFFNYEFLYKFIKPLFGESVRLILSDTDSFLLEFTTQNVFKDLAPHMDRFDTSNFSPTHELYSPHNRCVTGKIKFETADEFIREVCALRTKMYSFTIGDKEKKVAKGVPASVQSKALKFETYKNCLFNRQTTRHKFHSIRSYNHMLFTIEQSKKTLSPFCDKRYWLDDEISSLSFGHWLIPYYEILRRNITGQPPILCSVHKVYIQMCGCKAIKK